MNRLCVPFSYLSLSYFRGGRSFSLREFHLLPPAKFSAVRARGFQKHDVSSPMVEGFYKRPLPSPAVDFVSDHGKQLFVESIQSGTMECFYRLIPYFQTQSELTYCGLASLAMVLNALAIDPGRKWKGGPWRWFDESMLEDSEPLEMVKGRGIAFMKLAHLAQCAGAKVDAFYATQSNIDDFRKYVIKCSSSNNCHLISSYHRAALNQTGSGHFSPMGGYHVGKDMVLILDVARFKYPPHWIPLPLLWEGMNYVVKSIGKSRGFMLISKPHGETVERNT